MSAFTSRHAAASPPGSISADLNPHDLNEREHPGNGSSPKDRELTPPNSPNTDATAATPPTSPDTCDTTPPAPSTSSPREKATATPLYRRFLKVVTMSPATTPQSPSREKRNSPLKNNESPIWGRGVPTNGRASPTKQKLEVGLNGFHFTCELPMSKVTPKKDTRGTPKRDSPSSVKMDGALVDVGAVAKKGTPSKAPIGSPLRKPATPGTTRSPKPATVRSPKKDTPVKRRLFGTPMQSREIANGQVNRASKPSTPVKALPCTPLRKVATPDPANHVGSAKISPTKSIKMASTYLHGLPSESKTPPTVKDQQESNAETTTTSEGQFPDATVLLKANQSSASAEPARTSRFKTPRSISTDIGSLMANHHVRKHDGGSPRHPMDINTSAPPTPLRHAARRLDVAPIIRYTKEHKALTSDVLATTYLEPRSDSVAEEHVGDSVRTALRTTIQEREEGSNVGKRPLKSPTTVLDSPVIVTPHTKGATYQYPPLLSSPSEPEPDPKPTPLCQANKKYVQFQSQEPFTTPAKPTFAKTHRPVGTDPNVFLAMHQEMNSLKQLLSSSLGVPYTFPSYGPANEFELPVMANPALESAQRTRGTPKRTTSSLSNKSTSTNSSMSTVRASMLMNPKAPDATPRSTTKARWLYTKVTPAQARRRELGVTKKTGAKQATGTVTSMKPRLTSALAHKSAATPLAKPRNLPKATSPMKTPAKSNSQPASTRTKTSATLAKPILKPGVAGNSRSMRKSTLDPPKPAVPYRSTRKLLAAPRPLATPKATKVPYDPSTDPRPYEKKFASAVDIADRVAGWKSGDKNDNINKQTYSKPNSKVKVTEEEESHTPAGSPTKLPSHALSSAPTKPSTPISKRTAAKGPTAVLRTPRRLPKITPLRKLAPRTPALRQIMDPNAFRTPSKDIESSLDNAIDRKIEEDRRRGAWR